MRRRVKQLFFFMIIFVLVLLTGCSSSDEEQIMKPAVKKDVYVYDQGKFINEDIEKSINNLLVQLEEKTEIEFAVITIPTLNDLTIEKYAVELGNALGIGKAEEDNGILLLISKKDTKVRLEIGKGLQGIITDSVSGRILDDFFVPAREKDDYDKASLNTVQAVINYLAESEDYDFSIDGINTEITVEQEQETPWYEILMIIVGIIVLLILLEYITGKIWGDGFGDGIVFIILHFASDSSSGGSSGGFGGGSFNGGGASR